jgi:hypothetical protein
VRISIIKKNNSERTLCTAQHGRCGSYLQHRVFGEYNHVAYAHPSPARRLVCQAVPQPHVEVSTERYLGRLALHVDNVDAWGRGGGEDECIATSVGVHGTPRACAFCRYLAPYELIFDGAEAVWIS